MPARRCGGRPSEWRRRRPLTAVPCPTPHHLRSLPSPELRLLSRRPLRARSPLISWIRRHRGRLGGQGSHDDDLIQRRLPKAQSPLLSPPIPRFTQSGHRPAACPQSSESLIARPPFDIIARASLLEGLQSLSFLLRHAHRMSIFHKIKDAVDREVQRLDTGFDHARSTVEGACAQTVHDRSGADRYLSNPIAGFLNPNRAYYTPHAVDPPYRSLPFP